MSTVQIIGIAVAAAIAPARAAASVRRIASARFGVIVGEVSIGATARASPRRRARGRRNAGAADPDVDDHAFLVHHGPPRLTGPRVARRARVDRAAAMPGAVTTAPASGRAPAA